MMAPLDRCAQENTCNDHRAVLNSKIERAKLEATGIGAAACSRHGFFCPHACVDFHGGEGYVVNRSQSPRRVSRSPT